MQPQKDSSWNRRGSQGWNDVLCVGSNVQEDSKADRKEVRRFQMYLHQSTT